MMNFIIFILLSSTWQAKAYPYNTKGEAPDWQLADERLMALLNRLDTADEVREDQNDDQKLFDEDNLNEKSLPTNQINVDDPDPNGKNDSAATIDIDNIEVSEDENAALRIPKESPIQDFDQIWNNKDLWLPKPTFLDLSNINFDELENMKIPEFKFSSPDNDYFEWRRKFNKKRRQIKMYFGLGVLLVSSLILGAIKLINFLKKNRRPRENDRSVLILSSNSDSHQ